MQSTLVVNGVVCKTISIEKIWNVVVDGIPQQLYYGWVKSKRAIGGKARELKLKYICIVCEKECSGLLRNSRKFCSISCSAKVSIKLTHSKRIKMPGNRELKIRVKSFIESRVANGRIVPPKVCSNCKTNGRIVAHHPNYDKPNEVMWLCYSCHNKLHYGNKDIKGELVVYNI